MSKTQRILVDKIQRKEKLTFNGIQIWDTFVHVSQGDHIITIQDRNGNPWVKKTTAIQFKNKILENQEIVNDLREIIKRKSQSEEDRVIIKCIKKVLSENKNLDFEKIQ
jgi:hypothetical protein